MEEEIISNPLGKLIRELRLSKGWNYSDLERESGVLRQTITAIENVGQINPSGKTLTKLAAALNVPPKLLFTAAGFTMESPEEQIPSKQELLMEAEKIEIEMRELIRKLRLL